MMRLTFRFTRFTAGSSMKSSASAREHYLEPPARVLDLRRPHQSQPPSQRVSKSVSACGNDLRERLGIVRAARAARGIGPRSGWRAGRPCCAPGTGPSCRRQSPAGRCRTGRSCRAPTRQRTAPAGGSARRALRPSPANRCPSTSMVRPTARAPSPKNCRRVDSLITATMRCASRSSVVNGAPSRKSNRMIRQNSPSVRFRYDCTRVPFRYEKTPFG